jgi:CheY-like chemotaxis protein
MSLFPSDARRQLEDKWRSKLEEASIRHEAATAEWEVIRTAESGVGLDGLADCDKRERTRQLASEAAAEYARVLRIFTDLTLHGKPPEEETIMNCIETDRDLTACGRLISIVDDDESVRAATQTLLRSASYQVRAFGSADELLNSECLGAIDCLILDVRMPGIDGLELQRRLRASGSTVEIIFISAHDDAMVRQKAMAAGAREFLCKPFDGGTLLSILEDAVGAGRQASARAVERTG